MRMPGQHRERHLSTRIGWLRAGVLGANDGIVSTASLIAGVGAAHSSHGGIVLAGVSALVAGAMSMAAGEYVSVHSQFDTEHADLLRERAELEADPSGERKELSAIYVKRGLDLDLADRVAGQLMARDALGAHAQDELGISPAMSARPVQAAVVAPRRAARPIRSAIPAMSASSMSTISPGSTLRPSSAPRTAPRSST